MLCEVNFCSAEHFGQKAFYFFLLRHFGLVPYPNALISCSFDAIFRLSLLRNRKKMEI